MARAAQVGYHDGEQLFSGAAGNMVRRAPGARGVLTSRARETERERETEERGGSGSGRAGGGPSPFGDGDRCRVCRCQQ